MSSNVANPVPSPEGKVSRYRSLRQARSNSPPPPLPPVPPVVAENNGVKRSQSRYRRSNTVNATSAQTPISLRDRSDRPPRVPLPDLPKQAAPLEPPRQHGISHAVSLPDFPAPSLRTAGGKTATRTRRTTTVTRDDDYDRREVIPNEAAEILAKEQVRYDRIKAQQRAEREGKLKAAEFERLAKEQEQLEQEEAAREAEEAERVRRDEAAREEQREQDEREQRKREEREQRKAREREDAERQKHRLGLEKRTRRPSEIRAPTREEYDSAPPLLTPSSSITPTSAGNSASKKFGFFKRRREEASPMSSPPGRAPAVRPSTSHVSPPRLPSIGNVSYKDAIPEIPMIKPGGKGIVPLTDAPVSASNHGDRRVRIECGRSFCSLPITPTTSALQLIRSASTVMSEPIDPRASVMYEVFTKAGVKRPLRMYEHVRDVLNSWDNDNQHSLLIVPSEIGHDNELYVSFAPKQRPEDQSWWLNYSTKPHKWEKRWITMRADGQISMAKNETGKDSVNICHLSDFEIYTPTLEQKKKVIKPPKKYCYSVKSQQKSSMFLEMTNFIHFFCSNDKEAAEGFFSTLQNWRSWYLVNVMGEGQASKGEQKPVAETKAASGLLDVKADDTHKSQRDSHYILGTLGSLNLDFDSFAAELEQPHPKRRSISFSENRPLGTFGVTTIISAQEHSRLEREKQERERQEKTRQDREQQIQQRMQYARGGPPPRRENPPPRRERQHPPLAFRGPQPGAQRPSTARSHAPNGEGTFNSNGLLGTQYQQRQQAQHHLQPTHADHSNNGLHRRSGSIRSNISRRNSIDGSSRAGSIRGGVGVGMPKPLIDLSPQYKEPPQFQRKGKGFKPEFIGSGGLVESIPNNVENPFTLPNANDWRARPSTSSAHAPSMMQHPRPQHALPGAADPRTKSLRGHGVKLDQRGSVDEKEAFTGGGLLSKSGNGWGHDNRGHGVMNGHLAKGPMIDLSEKSKFVDGSLLRRVEREGGAFPAPGGGAGGAGQPF